MDDSDELLSQSEKKGALINFMLQQANLHKAELENEVNKILQLTYLVCTTLKRRELNKQIWNWNSK